MDNSPSSMINRLKPYRVKHFPMVEEYMGYTLINGRWHSLTTQPTLAKVKAHLRENTQPGEVIAILRVHRKTNVMLVGHPADRLPSNHPFKRGKHTLRLGKAEIEEVTNA